VPARRGEHEVRAGGERVEVELVAARDLHQQVELGVHRIFLHDLRVVRGRLRSKGSIHDGDATRRRRGHFGGIETRLRCGWHRTEAAVQPAAQPLQPYGSQHAACRVPCRVRNFDTLRHLCWGGRHLRAAHLICESPQKIIPANAGVAVGCRSPPEPCRPTKVLTAWRPSQSWMSTAPFLTVRCCTSSTSSMPRGLLCLRRSRSRPG